jgi:DNA-binding transcriptional LysR family regulator
VPELRQLRAFIAVATELNFTRAAGRLHVGQQAVSKTVRQLERELGVDLLERSPHRVRLTTAGQALFDLGPDVLAVADAAFAMARKAGHGLTGTVKIGATPAICPMEREEIARILRSEGDMTVDVTEVRRESIRTMLRNRELDIAFARAVEPTDDLEWVALRPTKAVLYAPPGHQLATADAVSLASLNGHRILTWNPPGTPYTDLLLERLAAAGAVVEPVQARVTGGTLLDLESTDAVALLPRGWPLAVGVVAVRLLDEVTLPLLMLWRAGSDSELAIRRLRQGLS